MNSTPFPSPTDAPAVAGTDRLADYDAVIVGAGAAGLAAALELQSAGRSVLVLEARDRIGGRAFTDTRSLGLPFDQGAQFIHSAQVNPFAGIARQLGHRTSSSSVADVRLTSNGAPVDSVEGVKLLEKGIASLRRRMWWRLACKADVSLAAFLGRDQWQDLAARYAAFDMATDVDAMSARDLSRRIAGEDLSVDGGFGQLVADHGRAAPVRLSHSVRSISWSGEGRVTIEGAFGSIVARTCIVTVPPSVLASESIRFAPALPMQKQEAFAALRGGAFIKVGLKLPEGYNFASEFAADTARALQGEMAVWHFSRRAPLATMIVSGKHARNLVEAGRDTLFDHARAGLARLVGPRIAGRVNAVTTHDWLGDPFSLGSYSVLEIGSISARSAYAAPVADRLFFAGEAAEGSLALTVAGAHLSGLKAAAEVQSVLRGP